MKKILIKVFTVFAAISVFSVLAAPAKSAIKWVEPVKGVRLMKLPSFASQELTKIPHKAKVIILHTEAELVSIDSRQGHWVIVKWRDFVGWTFDEDLVWGSSIDTKTIELNGLIWQRCSYGQTDDADCSGQHAELPLQFEDKDFQNRKLIKGPFVEACQKLNSISYAGIKKWRVPSIAELKTIVYCSKGILRPAKDFTSCQKDSQKPTIDSTLFPNTFRLIYVTSDRFQPELNSSVFSIDFGTGRTASSYSDIAMYGMLRCVADR